MRVRLMKCHACGGRKQLPSPTAYVYCDYCGALADWDFRTACSIGNALPGPAYESLRAQIAPALAQAKLRGDTNTTKHLYTQLFAKHIELCPSSYSPRIVNSEYRLKYLDYYSDSMVVRDCDPNVARLSALLDQRIAELRQAHFLQSGGVALGIFGLLIASQPMNNQSPITRSGTCTRRFASSIARTCRECGTPAFSPSIPTSSVPSSSSALASRRSSRVGSPGFRRRCSNICSRTPDCATSTSMSPIPRSCSGVVGAVERAWTR